MTAKDSENTSKLPPIQTYLSLPEKTACPNSKCKRDLYYHPPTQVNDVKAPILLSCASCKHTFPFPPTADSQLPTERGSVTETHYEVLGVGKAATTDEISRAYRKKSLQCHPDRTTGREAEWERLTKAYEVLGDKRKRYWYDIELEKGTGETGTEDPTAQVKTDPEKFFQDLFGGERFYDLIGISSVGRLIGEAMHNSPSEPEPEKTPEEKAAEQAKETAERAERVRVLVANLAYKLDLYALDDDLETRMDRWRTRCKQETDELKNERFGAEILHAVGYVYRIKATTHPLRSGRSWGNSISARLTAWGSTYYTLSTIFSTVRKAYSIKSIFVALQTAEANPDATPEQKQALEEKAAKAAIEALWSGVRLEIYDVTKEVCDVVLDPEIITKARCMDRIDALEVLGLEFEAAKPDIVSEDFVNVEHKTGV